MDKKIVASTDHESQLHFPVDLVRKRLREGNFAKHVAPGAPIFLSAVLSDLATTILRGANQELRREDGAEVSSSKRQRIHPRHIQGALKAQKELQQLFRGITKPQRELDHSGLRGLVLMIDGNRGSGKTQLLEALHVAVKDKVPCHFEVDMYDRCFDVAAERSPAVFSLVSHVHRTTACLAQLRRLQDEASVAEGKFCSVDCSPLSRLASAMQSYSSRDIDDAQIGVFMDFFDGSMSESKPAELVLFSDVDVGVCLKRLAEGRRRKASSAATAVSASGGEAASSTVTETATANPLPSTALLEGMDNFLFELTLRQCALLGNVVVVPWHRISHVDEVLDVLIRVRHKPTKSNIGSEGAGQRCYRPPRVRFESGVVVDDIREKSRVFVYTTQAELEVAFACLRAKEDPFGEDSDEDESDDDNNVCGETATNDTTSRSDSSTFDGSAVAPRTVFVASSLWPEKSNELKRVVMAHLSRLHDVVFFDSTKRTDTYGLSSWLADGGVENSE